METWERAKLGDLIETQKGYAFKSGWYTDSGRPIVKVSDFTHDSVDSGNLICIPQEIAEDYLKYELKAGDVIVQTVGSWPTNPASVVGKCIRIPESAAGALLNQNAVKLSPSKSLDSRFLFYLLRNEDFKTYIIGTAQGAASQAAITLEAIRAYGFAIPPLPVQRRIAGILSAYDELIENNQRRIRILEKMARTLYREWFVHLRFPGHETVPCVDSPFGPIPQGWEVKAIHQFGKVITGKTPSKANPDFYGDDMPFVKTPDMHGNMFVLSAGERLSKAGVESQANKTIPTGSLCVSCIGTIGVVSITTEDCQTNQQINSVALAKEQSREFLFLRLQDSKQILENLGANGATMGNVNKGKFESIEVVTPPDELLHRYHRLVAPMFSEILNLSRLIQNLRHTRDLLLPRLLSGQVAL